MGFHRRIINEEVTKKYLENHKLDLLYSSESLIFTDSLSSEVFELFKEGKSVEEIQIIINKKTT